MTIMIIMVIMEEILKMSLLMPMSSPVMITISNLRNDRESKKLNKELVLEKK